MTDVNDDAKDIFRRVEVLTGHGRRRRWSDEPKMLVAAEAMVPGAVIIADRAALADLHKSSFHMAALGIGGQAEQPARDHAGICGHSRCGEHSTAASIHVASSAE